MDADPGMGADTKKFDGAKVLVDLAFHTDAITCLKGIYAYTNYLQTFKYTFIYTLMFCKIMLLQYNISLNAQQNTIYPKSNDTHD